MNKQEAIEAYMLLGAPITVAKAYSFFRTTELRKVISRMRKKGFVILHEDIEGFDANGYDCKYREYWLDRESKQPKEMNIQFAPSGKRAR